MPLEKQVISVPFTGGVEEKTDPVLVEKDKLLSLSNYSFNKNGALARRDAWTKLSEYTLSGLSTQAEAFAHDAELLVIDGSNSLKSHIPGLTGVDWGTRTGAIPYTQLRKDVISRSYGYQCEFDSVSSGGLTCFVFRQMTASAGTSQGIRAVIVDEATGSAWPTLTVSTSATAIRPRVCVVDTKFAIVYSDGTVLKGFTVNIGSTTTAGPTNLTTALHANAFYEVAGGSTGLLVFGTTTALKSVSALTFNSSLSVVATEATVIDSGTLAQADVKSICVAGFSASKFGVVVGANTVGKDVYTVIIDNAAGTLTIGSSATDVLLYVASAITAVATSSTSLTVVCAPLLAGAGLYAHSRFTLASDNTIASIATFQSLTITTATGGPGPYLAGKAFTWGGVVCVPVATGPIYTATTANSTQPGLFVVTTGGALVATAMLGVYGDAPTAGFLPSVTIPSSSASNVFSLGVPEAGAILGRFEGLTLTQQGISRIQLAFGRNYASSSHAFAPLWHAEAAGSVYLSGGFLAMYDGVNVTEAGFCYYPEGLTAAAAGAAGNPNGTYQICAVYEWVDSKGRRHQSAPSPAVSVTVSSKQITMTSPCLMLGARSSGATIVFYRTVASGTTFYRDAASWLPNVNSTAAATVSYTSDVSDTQLAGNEILYSPTDSNTAGAELFHECPPSCRSIVSHHKRIFLAGLEDPREFRYSHQATQGVGLAFSSLLSGRIPEGFGDISALGAMDDKLVIYAPSHKFMVAGDGPNLAGMNSTYSEPQLLPSDVGCIDQRTVCNLPTGQAYQSRHGYYLLNRALADDYIGSPVEPSVSGATITSAVLLEDKSQLRLSLAAGGCLSYDLLYGQWCHFSGASVIPASACVWNGLYTIADSTSGCMLQDSVGSYRDLGTAAIVGGFTTAWLKGVALNGWARFWRFLLQFWLRGDSRILIEVFANYDTTQCADSFVIDSTATSFGSTVRAVTARYHLAAQKADALQFRATDTPIASPWQGAEFSGMTLELGVKKGSSKKAQQQASAKPGVLDATLGGPLVPTR